MQIVEIMIANRKINKHSIVALSVALSSTLLLASANASVPIAGENCSKLGLKVKAGAMTFSCMKTGKQLVWKKVKTSAIRSPLSPAPTETPKPSIFANQSALTRFISLAQAARANAANKLPILDTSGAVTINQVAGQGLPQFVTASTTDRFTFLGPTPFVETDPTRTGAVSQITKDHRMVYQARDALPPWAVAFTISTSD